MSININGVLLVGGKKLKASVLATKQDTHTWMILSVRAEQAYGSTPFAADTVMSQSGGVDFEDLASLKKADGNMDITALAAEREFREEAPGYELVPGTLEKVGEPYETSEDHVIFFRAQAQKVSSATSIDTVKSKAQQEIKDDVFLLNVSEFIQKYQLDTCDFSNEEDRSYVMQSLLDVASGQGVIDKHSNPSKPNEERWDDYSNSYNVKYMVDYIREIIQTPSQGEARKVQPTYTPLPIE